MSNVNKYINDFVTNSVIVSNLQQNSKPNLKYFTSFFNDIVGIKEIAKNDQSFTYYCYNR